LYSPKKVDVCEECGHTYLIAEGGCCSVTGEGDEAREALPLK